ncbi:MAG: hypothetical protein FJX89_00405 [Bacteroidetes bacterium]|nr:hypothetical protein [Bacteroidota bacterium]
MQQNTSQQIDDILDSLNGLAPASPAPFLHTRIVARLQREQSSPGYIVLRWLSRPAVAIGLSALLLLMNGYVLFIDSRPSVPTALEENSMAMVQEYDINFTSAYEPLADEAP